MLSNKRIINKTKNTVLADTAEIAGTWVSRLKGLMFRAKMPLRYGMVLIPCGSVHTCFMRFNIDIVLVDEEGKVLHVMEDVAPFRFSPLLRHARMVIELPPGVIRSSGTEPGDQMNLSFSGILAGNSLDNVE